MRVNGRSAENHSQAASAGIPPGDTRYLQRSGRPLCGVSELNLESGIGEIGNSWLCVVLSLTAVRFFPLAYLPAAAALAFLDGSQCLQGLSGRRLWVGWCWGRRVLGQLTSALSLGWLLQICCTNISPRCVCIISLNYI